MLKIESLHSVLEFGGRFRFLPLVGVSIAAVLLLGYYLLPAGSPPQMRSQTRLPSRSPEVEQFPSEIPILAATAFAIPDWKRPNGQDFWPSIQQPLTKSAEDADLEEDSEVIGVFVDGRARAYCIAALSGDPKFHVVNDVLAARPVTIAYCDLTRCARVFIGTRGDAPLSIAVAGWDHEEGMVLYIDGDNYALESGKNLTRPSGLPLPYPRMKHTRMTWGQWRRFHPDTAVYILPPPCS